MTKTWKEIKASRPDTPARRDAYEKSRQEAVASIVAHSLAELRKMRSVTQAELAHAIGVAQPSLSEQERRGDWRLSTLRQYVEGLGGRLEVSAVFDDISMPLSLLDLEGTSESA